MARQRFKFDASVFAVVRDSNKLLCLRRSGTGWFDGYWSLPAGAHDGQESFVNSVCRELNEETSLVARAENCHLLHVQQVFIGQSSEWLALYFGVDLFEGTPRVAEPDKHDRLEWRDSFEDQDMMVPYVREALKQITLGSNFSIYKE